MQILNDEYQQQYQKIGENGESNEGKKRES